MLLKLPRANKNQARGDPTVLQNLIYPSLYTNGPAPLGVEFLMVYPAIKLLATD